VMCLNKLKHVAMIASRDQWWDTS